MTRDPAFNPHAPPRAPAPDARIAPLLALLSLLSTVGIACSRTEPVHPESPARIVNPPPRKSDLFGVSLAFCGDVDGDGLPDIAIGSPSGSELIPGQVFEYSGKTGRLIRVLSDRAGSAMFGVEIACVGDIDGDGVPEIAATRSHRVVRGEIKSIDILSGRSGEPLRSIKALADEPRFGFQIECPGDFDGDGVNDLLTCSGDDDPLFPGSRGRVLVVSAVSGRRILSIEVTPTLTWWWAGRTLCPVGDVDADGTPDFAAVIKRVVHVYSGCDGNELLALRSNETLTEFGRSVCGIGDIDGDGFGDIAIGAPEVQWLMNELPGTVTLYSGKTGAQLNWFFGPRGELRLGIALARLGDVNRDGTEDLLVSRNDVLAGGAVLCLSGRDGSLLFKAADSGREHDGVAVVGWRIVSGPDVDGDGTPDFMSSRLSPTGIGQTGQGVLLFSGKDGHLLHEFRHERSVDG